MRRTTTVEPSKPVEPAEPLSHVIKGNHARGANPEPLHPSFSTFIYAIINNTNYSIHKIHFLQEENDEASGNCDDC